MQQRWLLVVESIPAPAPIQAHSTGGRVCSSLPGNVLISDRIAVEQIHPPVGIRNKTHAFLGAKRPKLKHSTYLVKKTQHTLNFDVFDAGNDMVSLATLL